MIGAAIYLIGRSLVNATRRRVARLRQPKYLIGLVVGGLYFYWFFFRPRRGAGLGAVASPGGEIVAVGLVGTLVLLKWLFGTAETPFTFSLAETQYLFPAPLTRRQVIDFKLLRSQLPLFLSAVLSALIFSGGQVTGVRLFRVVGLWVVYSTLQLHYAGASLVRASLTQHGVTGLRRRLGPLIGVASLVALVWWSLRRALPGIVAAFEDGSAQGYAALARVMHTGPPGVLLWPLQALVAPLVAASPAACASRLPAALLVLTVHYVWVVRSTLAFEEAAVEHAARMARRIEAARQGRWGERSMRAQQTTGPIRLRLAPTGAPAGAILWKNAVGATRDLSQRTLVLTVALVIGGSMALASGQLRALDLVAVILVALGAMALVLGPLVARCDLRQDLEMLDVLKGYPVQGRELVAGEVAAPVTLIGLVVWSCLLGAFAATAARPGLELPPLGDRLALLLAALPATAAVLLVLVLVQNAAVLLFPAWIGVGRDRAVGLEATGQRILMSAGSMIVLFVVLVPAVLAGGIAGVGAHAAGVSMLWTLPLGSLVGAGVVAFEGALAVHFLGGVFDRMDPAAAGPG